MPLGSKTSLNSARGAVPPGATIEVETMKKWTRQNIVTSSSPPKSFLVMPLLGRRMRNNQNGCGANVATLKAAFMESGDTLLVARTTSEDAVAAVADAAAVAATESNRYESSNALVLVLSLRLLLI